jgi:hypothetical protein
MRTRISGVKRDRANGYPVVDNETNARLGRVNPVYLPSHIRRGRAQASPWWQALDLNGDPVGEPQQRRQDAAEELAR